MRNKLLALSFIVAVIYASWWLGNDVVISPQSYLAILVGVVPVVICVWIMLRGANPDRRLLLKLFFAALAIRYLLAYVIYTQHLQPFLGPDSETYDAFGFALLQSWRG